MPPPRIRRSVLTVTVSKSVIIVPPFHFFVGSLFHFFQVLVPGAQIASRPVDAGSVNRVKSSRFAFVSQPPAGSAFPSTVVRIGNLNRLTLPLRNRICHMSR